MSEFDVGLQSSCSFILIVVFFFVLFIIIFVYFFHSLSYLLGGDIYLQGPLWPNIVLDTYILIDNIWKNRISRGNFYSISKS